MTELDALKQVLAQYALRPNRALGQNFLVDGAILDDIAQAATGLGEAVFEIGPGLGALTRRLVERASRVIAVEKDAALRAVLGETLQNPKLTLILGDALRVEPGEYLDEPFHVAGNLPYYITTPLAERYLQLAPLSLTFLVQREAADRFFAQPKDRVYGPLAALTQVFYRAERILEAPRSCFFPQPEVDSTAVHFVPLENRNPAERMGFLHFCNRAFSMRRKTLLNNFRDLDGFPDAMQALALPLAVRAEALDADTLYALYHAVEALN